MTRWSATTPTPPPLLRARLRLALHSSGGKNQNRLVHHAVGRQLRSPRQRASCVPANRMFRDRCWSMVCLSGDGSGDCRFCLDNRASADAATAPDAGGAALWRVLASARRGLVEASGAAREGRSSRVASGGDGCFGVHCRRLASRRPSALSRPGCAACRRRVRCDRNLARRTLRRGPGAARRRASAFRSGKGSVRP